MNDAGEAYEFVYRGTLAQEALDKAGRRRPGLNVTLIEIVTALGMELLDVDLLDTAQQMAQVYACITAFENSARRFVTKVLAENHGENWWDTKVSEKIRRFAESRQADEEKTKWHGTRGDDPIFFTEMGHLVNIIEQNWTDFEDHVRRIEWAKSIFGTVERSRNVIMHGGVLAIGDIERVGIHVRDWIKQVGS